MKGLRRAAVAGSWYPGEPGRLRSDLDVALAAVDSDAASGRLIGLVSPHAGLMYSGVVAAYGYALLRRSTVRTVVLVGPSHRSAFEGCSVFPRGEWETPLGSVEVDEVAAAELVAASPSCFEDETAHRYEHSIEMQVPFLRHVAPGARIVPVLMGRQTRAEAEALGEALATVAPYALLVASSDLSHYHPAPVAHKIDRPVVDAVARLDAEGLMELLESDHGHACGGGPIVAVMRAARARGATRATILKYGDSGDAGEHDRSRVVGYLSAAFTGAP